MRPRHPRRRTTGWAAAAVLAIGLLSACSDQEAAYCDTLKDAQQQLLDLADQADAKKSDSAVDTLQPTVEILQGIRAEAPDELQDEWDTLVFAYQDLADALKRSGVDPDELDSDAAAADLTAAERRQLQDLATKLTSPRVVEAARGIQDQASEVCDVDFQP